ncbi:MAG TPA: flagellar hook protein FlgE [Stenotrophobium sp.]|jgi:flagellar hook protein FlgE|nr:flagellar hook protein FlgE [Stenotrophobium sp.]
MAFGIALSGLNAAQADLNTTANNIANSNTTGFKQSSAQFGDIYQSSAYGLSTQQIGSGVHLTQVAQNFQQGTVNITNNPLDMAISGSGFFTLSDNGSMVYSRAGNFSTDRNGYVVNGTGQQLQVFPPIAGGNGFNTGSLSSLQLSTADNPPSASTKITAQFNLPSSSTPPQAATFSADDPNSYNQTTSVTTYDSLGAAHTTSLFFVAGATANTWTMYATTDGTAMPGSTSLAYSSAGVLTTPAGGAVTLPPFTPANGAAPMAMTLDLDKSTQYGNQFAVSALTQDGYTTGKLTGVAVDSSGVIQARYTNGQSTALGQLALTSFANPQGLQQLGNTSFGETFASGQPIRGSANTSNFGQVQSGALEASNVDLTTQLVNMITAQRNYQANAQMIQTDNQLTQTIISSIR